MPHRAALSEPDIVEVRASLQVSALSVACTVVMSSAALVLGARDASAVLVAFGAIGFVDAAGSVALVSHFRHALHHERFDARLERRAHRIVLFGLFGVGLGAVVVSSVRLIIGAESHASGASTVLAALSLVVLALLAARKIALAARVHSAALRSDGHLSAVGAMQAAVTLAGTAATAIAGWGWADAATAIIVGVVATGLAAATWYRERARRRDL